MESSLFSPLDWVIVGIVLVSALLSLFRGFVKEILSLIGFMAAIILSIRFQHDVGALINITDSAVGKQVLGFFSVFALTLVAGAIVTKIVSSFIDGVGLTPLDRLLGTLFGALRGALIVLVLVLFLPKFLAIDQEAVWLESQLVPFFLELEAWFDKTFAKVQDISIQLIEKD